MRDIHYFEVSDALGLIIRRQALNGFTPYNPESPSFLTGDKGNFKSNDKEKPRPLGWGYMGLTFKILSVVCKRDEAEEFP